MPEGFLFDVRSFRAFTTIDFPMRSLCKKTLAQQRFLWQVRSFQTRNWNLSCGKVCVDGSVSSKKSLLHSLARRESGLKQALLPHSKPVVPSGVVTVVAMP